LDFAFFIEFVRIYIATKKHLHDSGNEILPLNIDEIDDHGEIDDSDNDTRTLCPTSVDHPKQLWLLMIASGVHVFGNAWATIFSTSATAYVPFVLLFIVQC